MSFNDYYGYATVKLSEDLLNYFGKNFYQLLGKEEISRDDFKIINRLNDLYLSGGSIINSLISYNVPLSEEEIKLAEKFHTDFIYKHQNTYNLNFSELNNKLKKSKLNNSKNSKKKPYEFEIKDESTIQLSQQSIDYINKYFLDYYHIYYYVDEGIINHIISVSRLYAKGESGQDYKTCKIKIEINDEQRKQAKNFIDEVDNIEKNGKKIDLTSINNLTRDKILNPQNHFSYFQLSEKAIQYIKGWYVFTDCPNVFSYNIFNTIIDDAIWDLQKTQEQKYKYDEMLPYSIEFLLELKDKLKTGCMLDLGKTKDALNITNRSKITDKLDMLLNSTHGFNPMIAALIDSKEKKWSYERFPYNGVYLSNMLFHSSLIDESNIKKQLKFTSDDLSYFLLKECEMIRKLEYTEYGKYFDTSTKALLVDYQLGFDPNKYLIEK